MTDSNRRPSRCKRDALPAELTAPSLKSGRANIGCTADIARQRLAGPAAPGLARRYSPLAPQAPASPKAGAPVADALGKKIFQEACVSCHNWTGVSQISPFATIAGTRGVNDPTATNVVQIVISGTTRHTPDGVISMPAFGDAYSDTEIAAVANYVSARFGAEPSKVTEKDVAALRSQAAD